LGRRCTTGGGEAHTPPPPAGSGCLCTTGGGGAHTPPPPAGSGCLCTLGGGGAHTPPPPALERGGGCAFGFIGGGGKGDETDVVVFAGGTAILLTDGVPLGGVPRKPWVVDCTGLGHMASEEGTATLLGSPFETALFKSAGICT